MKNTIASILFGLSITTVAASCGDDKVAAVECGNGTSLKDGACVSDTTCGAGTVASGGACVSSNMTTCGPGTMVEGTTCVPTVVPTSYTQVEHLGRPGINEALLLSDGFLTGYNATAPTFAGVPPATLDAVVGEAKTVLKALYLGVCFTNGVAGITNPANGLKPAGIQCHALGAAVLANDGETQTAASITASQAYADAVFGLFEPDVLRVDTSITSTYFHLCGGTSKQGLCGGRFPSDDVIDDTYNFLLAGGAIDASAPAQFRALVSDGVAFDTADVAGDHGSLQAGDPSNKNQGHPAISNTFPYSAAPF
ncbi:MAG: DUF4331 family protein [Proteobacteria bacterium]|nr:DUF4331 family protein [Pseudomonadota bacterium]